MDIKKTCLLHEGILPISGDQKLKTVLIEYKPTGEFHEVMPAGTSMGAISPAIKVKAVNDMLHIATKSHIDKRALRFDGEYTAWPIYFSCYKKAYTTDPIYNPEDMKLFLRCFKKKRLEWSISNLEQRALIFNDSGTVVDIMHKIFSEMLFMLRLSSREKHEDGPGVLFQKNNNDVEYFGLHYNQETQGIAITDHLRGVVIYDESAINYCAKTNKYNHISLLKSLLPISTDLINFQNKANSYKSFFFMKEMIEELSVEELSGHEKARYLRSITRSHREEFNAAYNCLNAFENNIELLHFCTE